MKLQKYLVLCAIFAGCLIVLPLTARQQGTGSQTQTDPSAQGTASQASQQTAKQQKKSSRELEKELGSQYKRWLNEDVVYIITPEERSAFLHLQTDEEREQFIEQFWERRNPDPESTENTFKEEHYRRIAYANEHFASGIPGWKTDRGRIYIIWGPADEIESHPSGGTYDRPPEEGGGTTETYPFEDWTYRYLEGVGSNITIEFVDTTMTGEYHMTMDPEEKDALLYVPGAGLTMMEEMGLASKTDRFDRTDGTHMGTTPGGFVPESMEEFTRLETFAKVQQAPPVKFKDLEAVVTSRMVRDQVKFQYRFDFLRITNDTVLVPITLQIPNRQMSFQEKDGVQSGTMNLFVRISSMTGRIVNTFEDTVRRDVPDSLLAQAVKGQSIYQKAVPLRPGLYRLDAVIKDVNSGNVGVVNTRLAVPQYDEDKLASSTLILADQMTRVSSKDIGLGQFVLGDIKVRPKMDATFSTEDPMGVFVQIYNLKVDDKTHKADANVEYCVLNAKDKDGEPVMKIDESSDKLPEHGEELTLEKPLSLSTLPPGRYRLEVRVTDNLAKTTIMPSAEFTVTSADKAK